MRSVGGVVALMLLVACGPAASHTSADPFTFSCRLPFAQMTGPGQWQSGFIAFPSGTFSADPSAPPNAGYYDTAVSRWLPAGANSVARDGRHYAYMTGGMGTTPSPPRLHIVDAASGVERVIGLELSDQIPYGVEDYAPDGIYLASGWEGATFGHWRVDPATGTVTDLGKADHFVDDGTGHAWVSAFNSNDPSPAPNVMGGPPLPNEVGRRDLNTGAVEIWFYHPGFNVAPAGAFVGGGILAWVEPPLGGHHEYWLVTSPGASRLVAQIDGGGGVADSHGIWMGSLDGLYLFTRDGQVKRMSTELGNPGAGCL